MSGKNLYTDDNPQTTLGGLGYRDVDAALETIERVETHFDRLLTEQIVPGWTPENVLPREYLSNGSECQAYYKKQKMYRILGMRNRAVGMVDRLKNEARQKEMQEAIVVFDEWLRLYRESLRKGGSLSDIPDCCEADESRDSKCVRKSDGKVFDLPRSFSRDKCLEGVRGFTMRSSCAPFKGC